jgi:hypothetical protein
MLHGHGGDVHGGGGKGEAIDGPDREEGFRVA